MHISPLPTFLSADRIGGGEPPSDDSDLEKLKARAEESWSGVLAATAWDKPNDVAIQRIREIPDDEIPFLTGKIIDLYTEWGCQCTPLAFALFERVDLAEVFCHTPLPSREKEATSLLHLMTSHGHDVVLASILNRMCPGDITPVGEKGKTPLHIAAMQERERSAQTLSYRIFDAARNGGLELTEEGEFVLILLEVSMPGSRPAEEGEILLGMWEELLALLDSPEPWDDSLFSLEDMQKISSFLREGTGNFLGNPKKNGREATVALLVAAMDPYQLALTDDRGNTPLHYAVGQGYTEIVATLIGKMSKPSMGLMNKEEKTALALAQEAGHADIEELLKEALA